MLVYITSLGRIYREQWQSSQNPLDLDKAIEAYYQAFQADPYSYYAGVNVIGLAIAKGDMTLATKIAHEVLSLCEQQQKQQKVSYWVDFTAGEVYLALGDIDKAKQEYARGLTRDPKPELFGRDSATKGAARMVHATR